MNAENISIGDELLIGQTVNTNASTIGEKLAEIGIQLKWVTTVGDDEKDIEDAFKLAWSRADAVLVTGGLGPTHDDITKTVVARFFDSKLVLDEDHLRKMKALFERYGIPMAKINETQALVPDKCVVIENTRGTAPGMLFEEKNKAFIVMPGVPAEMKGMMEKTVLPYLKEMSGGHVIKYKVLRTTGVPESTLFERITNLKEIETFAKVAFLPKYTGVDIRLTVHETDEKRADKKLARAEELMREKIGDCIYAEEETSLEEAVGRLLREKKLKIAVSESCTGGIIAGKITDVAGSSDYFERGVVTYSNRAKTELLGVPAELIEKHGAVSEEVASAMAENVKKISGADIGLSVTGIAGPAGGTPEKPVGTVFVAISYGGETTVKKLFFPGERNIVRERTANAALNFIRKTLTKK